jgi:hypothetical protein
MLTLTAVHVSRFANVRFVYFHRASKFCSERSGLHGKTDAMFHKPSGLLRDANCASNLVTANAVFAISGHPYRHEPLIQTKRRVLKDGSNLDAELSALVRAPTLPLPLLRQKRNVSTPTRWANDAVRPAASNQVVKAILRIREVNDCLLERLGCFFVRHNEGIVSCLS